MTAAAGRSRGNAGISLRAAAEASSPAAFFSVPGVRQALVRYAGRLIGPDWCELQADDVVQEAVTRLLEHERERRKRGQPSFWSQAAPAQRIKWLRTAMWHIIREGWRVGRFAVEPLERDDGRVLEDERLAETDRTAGVLDRVACRLLWASLTPVQRPAVWLYIDGFTAAEIGKRLGIPEDTVRSRLRGAKRRLLAAAALTGLGLVLLFGSLGSTVALGSAGVLTLLATKKKELALAALPLAVLAVLGACVADPAAAWRVVADIGPGFVEFLRVLVS